MPVTRNGKSVNPPPTEIVTVHPCLNCGSDDIELWDCNYSSFNPGGGRCKKCGRESKGEAGCMPTSAELAWIWNRQNDLNAKLILIDDEIQNLQAERRRLNTLKKKLSS